MSGTGEPILEVRDLHVEIPTSRGVVHAVDGASFTLEAGDVLGLVGESGCGKTMTLRAIVGLLPRPAHIVSGEVVYNGIDLTQLSPKSLRNVRGRQISLIFQEPMTALNPVMRVGEQIAEGPMRRLGQGREEARRTALELLQRVGVPDAERRLQAYPHELSGGLRQRVMIAIALACAPSVILCDEPTTALDVTIQDQILKLLLGLRNDLGVGIVIVTHDLAVIAQTCRSVAVMYAGEVVESGLVAEVFREPHHPYTLGLLRSVPDFENVRESLLPIPGAPPDLVHPPPGCRFHPRCPFVQPDCVEGDFPLRVRGRRATACIHPDAAIASVQEHAVIVDA
jgi:peptide/nickel transport system ATP-binding protein/oligopeptide transport system ATP-binding protein